MTGEGPTAARRSADGALRAVVRAEWRSALRERALWALLAMLAVLVLYAALAGRRGAAQERAMASAAQQAEAARAERLRGEVAAITAGGAVTHAADPRHPLQVGRTLHPRVAVLEAAPLAPLAVGQRDVSPQLVELTTEARVSDAAHDDGGSPLRRALGPFDLAFVLVFLWPLLVIAATFDLLSGERERGTLALVLSQPVSLREFAFGKAAQRGLLLGGAGAVLVWLGAGAAGVPLSSAGALGALALWTALVLAYTGFWLAAALAVNAWGRSSAANALTLVSLWLALGVVVPGLCAVAADTLHPSPSRVALVNLSREAAAEAGARAAALEGNHGQVASALGDLRALEVQAEVEARVAPVRQAFRDQLTAQQRVVERLRFASPALLAHEGLIDAAGSGVARQQHFAERVERFHAALKAFFFERVRAGRSLTAADYAAFPAFDTTDEPSGAMARRVAAALVGLLAQAAALLGLAWLGLRRVRVGP